MLLALLLVTVAAWGDNFAPVATFTGGMANLAIGLELQPDGSRRGQVRFSTSTGVHELRFAPAQWQTLARLVRAAMDEARELKDGTNGEPSEVAGLTVRAVRQVPQPGVQLSIKETSIVINDLGGLKGAMDEVNAALRKDR